MGEQDINMIEMSLFSLIFNSTDIDLNPVECDCLFEILKKGKVVHSKETTLPNSFDLSFLESGFYTYRVVKNNKVLQAGRITVLPRV